jgi:hypothetical protein
VTAHPCVAMQYTELLKSPQDRWIQGPTDQQNKTVSDMSSVLDEEEW